MFPGKDRLIEKASSRQKILNCIWTPYTVYYVVLFIIVIWSPGCGDKEACGLYGSSEQDVEREKTLDYEKQIL